MSPRGKELNEQMRTATLEKIKTGALEVFAAYGFYGATMKKIAAQTGLSYGLVYHYFASKEEIFTYLVDQAIESTKVVFETGLSGEDTAWNKLNKLAEILLQESFTGDAVLSFYIVLQAVAQGKDMTELRERTIAYSEKVYNMVVPVIVEGQQEGSVIDGDPLSLTASFLAMIQGMALFAYQGEGVPIPISKDILLNVLRK